MGKLQYKTRGMSTYRGKSRVYFLCHPEDFTKYFEGVSDEILEQQNVVVWYEPSVYYETESGQDEAARKQEEKEHFDNLANMQLVVMAVSEKLIRQGNEKVDADFSFAREQHIPILPLLQEPGLENAFSEKYGNIHLLNKNETDIYAIDYKEKLKKYLDTTLAGEELSAQIRKEFRGYVFLSYRKIDREWTQLFMKLLHETEAYRDIGVWYDELLVPGNNFDDSIKDALIRSDIFAVVVTPNLMQKDNYVMNVEYPEAVKAKKKIVPIIFRNVDEAELQKAYVNFPKCIYPDVESIRDAFGGVFIPMPETEDAVKAAEHNYLLGLAYLYGVDVEKNMDLAEHYLQKAMKQGEIKAGKKLVEIWWEGIGVQRDAKKARSYQWDVEYRYKELYLKENNIENALNYIEEYVRRADMYREEGEFDTAIYLYEGVLDVQDDVMDRYNLATNFYRDACTGLSDIFRRLGDDERAEGYLMVAQRMSEVIFGGLGDTTSTVHLIKDLGNLAAICCAKKDFQGARKYLLEALSHTERLLAKEETPEIELLWSRLMLQTADVHKAMNVDPKENVEKAFPVAKRVAEELQSQEAYYNLVKCYGYLGDIAANGGLVLKAGNYYLEMYPIIQKMIKEIGDANAYDNLAIYHFKMACLLRDRINIVEMAKAFEIYEMLAKKYPEDLSYAKSCEMIHDLIKA